ncbi:hypothetical protein F5X96DRAFT_148010 [Biscogniauxia mediterranea]|nr:hypothetical protein F5X96DRAFT_148010 [Biscogniauxia mediterranea]
MAGKGGFWTGLVQLFLLLPDVGDFFFFLFEELCLERISDLGFLPCKAGQDHVCYIYFSLISQYFSFCLCGSVRARAHTHTHTRSIAIVRIRSKFLFLFYMYLSLSLS